VLDAGRLMLDAGCWMLDVERSEIPQSGAGFWMLDAGCSMLVPK